MKEYTIRELSKMFDLPASTIRYYEDEGILTNVGRTSSGQRVFTDGHVTDPTAALRFPLFFRIAPRK